MPARPVSRFYNPLIDVLLMECCPMQAFIRAFFVLCLPLWFTPALAQPMQLAEAELGLLYSLLTLITALFLVFLVWQAHRWFRWRMLRALRPAARRWQTRTHQVIRARSALAAASGSLRLIRLLAQLLISYVAIERILSYFPETRALSGKLVDWLLNPLIRAAVALLETLPNVLLLVVLVLMTRYLLRALRLFFLAIERGSLRIEGFYPDWASPTRKIVSFLLIVCAMMVAYPYIPGSGTDAFKGVSLFIGVLFSLGSSGAVSNIVAGVILTYMRAFRMGDLVQIGQVKGVVLNQSLLVTKLQTMRNEEISLPNSVILQGPVTNLSSQGVKRGALLKTSISLGYDTPWRQAHALLLQAAANTPEVEKTPVPFVLQTALQDFYVCYELNAYTLHPEKLPLVLSALNQHIQDEFNRHGVQIMSPHFWFNRTDRPAMSPPEEWYLPPASPPDQPG